MRTARKPLSLHQSFNYAFDGIIHVLRTQRNMRIHFALAIGVLIAALSFDVSKFELIALMLAIVFVLIAEMVNTAIEAAVDVASTSFDPMAKLAKDIAAGAVLIASVNAVAIGYLVFAGKAATHRGTPLRGGLPSGHAAVAFAGWMAATLVLDDSSHRFLISSLTFIMAVLVAQTRVESGIHSTVEVGYGALLGSLTTLVIFQLFSAT